MKLGSLFTGYGGLDMAVSEVTGGKTVFVADICGDGKHKKVCKSPCTILAHRFPDAPNLGDVSLIDWAQWAGKIDILCAGFPCQDLSVAGVRAGLSGARSGLWSEVVRAITELKPRMVVLENVLGIYSASATGDVEPCAWCAGDDPDGDLRALDAVLAGLSQIGFDAEWVNLRASDVGAPHRRERWFCVAYPASDGRDEGWPEPARFIGRPDAPVGGHADERLTLLPSPRTSDTNGAGQHGDGGLDLRTAVATLLPTPAVNDMGAGKTVEAWDDWTDRMKAAHGNGNGNGASLSIEALRLLPTPTTQDGANNGGPSQFDRNTRPLNAEVLDHGTWGKYAEAIARWETVLGRTAPAPTEPGKNGSPRLSARFVEWLMGLPAGWITDVPGITRNEALKACGNGVVPQQAHAALVDMLAAISERTAA